MGEAKKSKTKRGGISGEQRQAKRCNGATVWEKKRAGGERIDERRADHICQNRGIQNPEEQSLPEEAYLGTRISGLGKLLADPGMPGGAWNYKGVTMDINPQILNYYCVLSIISQTRGIKEKIGRGRVRVWSAEEVGYFRQMKTLIPEKRPSKNALVWKTAI